MSPIPDDPGKNQNDREVEDMETPQFIVAASDSDSGEDDAYQGYQLLPQDPDAAGDAMMMGEGDHEEGTHPSAADGAESANLDQVIMHSLDQQDFQTTTGVPTQGAEDRLQASSTSQQPPESVSVWNEPRAVTNTQPMAKEEADAIKAAMAGFVLPMCNHPDWAMSVPEDEWKKQLFSRIHSNTKDSEKNREHSDKRTDSNR